MKGSLTNSPDRHTVPHDRQGIDNMASARPENAGLDASPRCGYLIAGDIVEDTLGTIFNTDTAGELAAAIVVALLEKGTLKCPHGHEANPISHLVGVN